MVRFHQRTFSLGGVNLKVMSWSEWQRTIGKDGHVKVADLVDGVTVLRRHVSSLVDVLLNGEDAVMQSIVHGAGNTGIDGSVWDFETQPCLFELELAEQIVTACSLRRGDAPNIELPYQLHPVRGNPYRQDGVLYNTRFGDISYKTPTETGNAMHYAAAFNPRGVVVHDGKSPVATTVPAGFELYVPTVPATVLEYLDGRSDMPTYYTKHGTAMAAEEDLFKYNLSTQGFVLPGVLSMVRRYLFRHVGKCPRLYRPSTFPARNSMAGINGDRFPTGAIQSHPDIDQLCDLARDELWQTTTPCTLKKQYCSKQKTRTILGTNNFIALGLRAALSGVTSGFMKKGVDSPILLGKNKFQPLSVVVEGRCLEADLASCDRSTPAIVRWFTANLLFELADEQKWLLPYVLNCCHDVVATMSGCFDKRGGLSSGDPVTSISNTIYSLVIYAQHMVLSAFRTGHRIGGLYLSDKLEIEDLLKLQPVLIYSDDVVFYNEPSLFKNYEFFTAHLDLLLGFKTDRSKSVITETPSFLGCRVVLGKYLVPQRVRILAALGYHLKATSVSEYYASAAAILMDACSCAEFDQEWYFDLVCGIAQCARKDGFNFPGISFFMDMWTRLSGLEKSKHQPCGYCGAPSVTISSCGLELCSYHARAHPHCPVSLACGHTAGSGACSECESGVANLRTELDKLLTEVPYQAPRTEILHVVNGLSSLPPGRYRSRAGVISVRRDIMGDTASVQDGEYQVIKVSQTCDGINMVQVRNNILRSRFITGAPGTGKTTYLLSVLKPDDVVYSPTHRTMLDLITAIGRCRFDPPKGATIQFPTPARDGPVIRLIGAGYYPGRNSYVDEAAYCNPLDILKILSKTPLVCVGDMNQLPPVGFSGPCFVFKLMPGSCLPEVYRFGNSVVSVIKHLYHDELVSRGPETGIKFLKEYHACGQVLTPYHKDRMDGAITIDSSQGCTYDVVTLHLPSPKSLTAARALVALTRARFYVFIHDPHHQLDEFFKIQEHHAPETAFYLGDDPVMVSNGEICKLSGMPRTTDKTLQSLLCAEGTASPLPQVGHNLGFYYSPDLPQFASIPHQVCEHWPVVTAINNPAWPDRLVCSMTKIDANSSPIYTAGYHVGPSVFLGIPHVLSYYLTLFRHGESQALPRSLMSTGRIALNVREYLDDDERAVADSNKHAFIGEVRGAGVGGSHHVTSKFLPPNLVPGSVLKIGVSCPGRAAKSLCTVTDVYLPDIREYLQPETVSKDYKVMVDFLPVRLMVWRDGTAYFHEGINPMEPISRYVKLGVDEAVLFDVDDFTTNARVTTKAGRVSVSPDKFLTPVVVSLTPPSLAPVNYKLLLARAYTVPGIGITTACAYVYARGEEDYTSYNKAVLSRDTAYPLTLKGRGYFFPHGEHLDPLL
uniref:Replicase polyprotein 1ab n=1 Tax=Bamboo rat arterivirus TaxID=3038165 RepID=A0AAT9TWQ9_9NIDO|nr:1b [Bamboo rat arterivirus]